MGKNISKDTISMGNEEIKTTENYWDCECKDNYIHPKSQSRCEVCGAVSEDQPDSIVSEVLAQGFKL